MFWMQMLRHPRNTLPNEASRPLRSSSSPRIKAMLSPFSRSRVSA